MSHLQSFLRGRNRPSPRVTISRCGRTASVVVVAVIIGSLCWLVVRDPIAGEHCIGFLGWFVGPTELIPQSEVLPVVEVEIAMVNRMMPGGVDDSSTTKVNLIMNRDRPEVDKDEHGHEQNVVERENETEDVVRHSLSPTINWVERMGRVGRRELVRVMWLVDVLVQGGVVKTTMNEINHHVCDEKEERNREQEVAPAVIVDIFVHSAVSTGNHNRERSHQDGHERKGSKSDLNFSFDLP